MVNRMEKIDEQIKREISRDLPIRFPGQIISVTAVEVSRDLAYAKVWISALSGTRAAVLKCQREAGRITGTLSKRLKMKRVPKLTFLSDNSPEKVGRIEALIEEIHTEKKERGC